MKGICLGLWFVLSLNNAIYCQYTSKIVRLDSIVNELVVHSIKANDTVSFKKRLQYKVFKIRQSDIDNNGTEEFILGVVKKTTFDTTVCNRINIWKIEKNTIIPMWLGSKMSHPLIDFELKKDGTVNVIYTIECENDGLYLLVEYKWRSFGLKFVKFIKREVDLNTAKQILNMEL